jgi:hypothetical protein
MDAAADRFLASLNPEDILQFDQDFQRHTTRKFRGLAAVCLKPQVKGPAFRERLLAKAREFLDGRLDKSDPGVVFFRDRESEEACHPLIGEAFGEAAPDLAVPPGLVPPDEMAILAAPPGPGGEMLRKAAAAAIPNADLAPAPLPDDIAFYREYPQLELSSLAQLGEFARDAYQNLASDQPPHARVDLAWQPPDSNPGA